MGLKPIEGAEHFWVGTRRGTRVNDPAYQRGGDIHLIEPDHHIQVRLPGNARPDLPERPVVNAVDAETDMDLKYWGCIQGLTRLICPRICAKVLRPTTQV